MTSANPVTLPLSGYAAQHIRLAVAGAVATITLDRPERKNPLTFESYAELANIFRAAARDKSVKAIVIAGAGGNFCSGGDVFEIIKPLTEMDAAGLLDFTRMTGEPVKSMRAAPQPIIAAVDGVCAGAGAIVAMAYPTSASERRTQKSLSFSTASVSAVAIWAHARSCRGSSARAAPRNSCSPVAFLAARMPSDGVFSTGCRRQPTCLPTRMCWPPNLPPGRPSATL